MTPPRAGSRLELEKGAASGLRRMVVVLASEEEEEEEEEEEVSKGVLLYLAGVLSLGSAVSIASSGLGCARWSLPPL